MSSARPIRVAVDAMGGDFAPQETVKGAVEAAAADNLEIILVGDERAVQQELAKYVIDKPTISIVPAEAVAKEGERPAFASLRKTQPSVAVTIGLVKEGKADAAVCMGSTGALYVSAVRILGLLEGIERPVTGISILGFTPKTIMLDLGPNVDCKPRQLVDFAIIGRVYLRYLLGIDNPTVALLSNGAEEGKGNRLVREAYPLLKKAGVNFVGNVEGTDIPAGKANVIVCDGFVGNVLIKFLEGLSWSLIDQLRGRLRGRVDEAYLEQMLSDLRAQTNVAESGGGPLLGVNGVVIAGHGRSLAPTFKGGILLAKRAVENRFLESLKQELRKVSQEVTK